MGNILKEARPIETLQVSWNDFEHLNWSVILRTCQIKLISLPLVKLQLYYRPTQMILKLHKISYTYLISFTTKLNFHICTCVTYFDNKIQFKWNVCYIVIDLLTWLAYMHLVTFNLCLYGLKTIIQYVEVTYFISVDCSIISTNNKGPWLFTSK